MAGKKEKTVPAEIQIVQNCNPLKQSTYKNIITENGNAFNPDLNILQDKRMKVSIFYFRSFGALNYYVYSTTFDK